MDHKKTKPAADHAVSPFRAKMRLIGKVLDELTDYTVYLQEQGYTTIECSPDRVATLDKQPEKTRMNSTESSVDIENELNIIAGRVARCVNCLLHKQRGHTVPGQGSVHPDIMFIGEGPGEEEDLQGIPFVGKAGRLLTRMIVRMGYQRQDVFIANIVKCRPPNNRKPMPDEMEACLPYLKEQIALLKPKVIVALGATALEGLVGPPVKITRQRGTWMAFEGIHLMPTFHPSYLLRTPSAGWNVWDDMLEVLKYLGRKPLPPRKRKTKK